MNGIVVASIYAPNGNPQPGPKFDYKLAWLERLSGARGRVSSNGGVPVVLAGDYNVVPEPRDIYPTNSCDDDALVQPASRAAYRKLIEQGWTDAVRRAIPKRRCTPSGTTAASVGRGMPASASITCC